MPPADENRSLPTRVRDAAAARVTAAGAAAGRRVDAAGRRVDAAGRRIELVGEAATRAADRARSPFVRRPRPDVGGWTADEFTAFLAAPRHLTPPLRSGHFAVRMTSALGGSLPVEATLLARAIADAAPPLGQEISPTLLDIVDRYLPDTLMAFRNSVGAAGVSTEGRRLVVDQLRLLHQVTGDVQRAQAEHDDRELRVQEAFLRERFASPTGGSGLDLTPPPPPTPPHGATPVPGRADISAGRSDTITGRAEALAGGGRPAAAPRTSRRGATHATASTAASAASPGSLATSRSRAHHRLTGGGMPTGVFHPEPGSSGTLTVRLALPRGVPVTLTAISELRTGATAFATSRSRRLSARRKQAGFGSSQAEVTHVLELPQIARFVLLASTGAGSGPVDAVLFLTEGANSAELPTTLFRRGEAATTVIASGHDTSDGLFLRNESTVFRTLQDASTGYGYTGVTWISPDTPAV